MAREIVVLPDPAALARAAADRFVSIARSARAERYLFTVALSGGSTPRAVYELLARDEYRSQVDWDHVHVFWGDERCVPPDHPDSNYGMARRALLSKVNVPDRNVHRMQGESDPARAALEYEAELRDAFQIAPAQWPRFDLILLGMGADGHTASLFPGTPALHEPNRSVVANHVAQLHTDRITFTPPLLNHAAHVLFLITGADKSHALHSVLNGEYNPDRYPAQIVAPMDGQLTWLVDKTAAVSLNG